MKKNWILLICLFTIAIQADQQNIFFVHGFTQNTNQTKPLEDYLKNNGFDKFMIYEHLGYFSFGPIGLTHQLPGMIKQLNLPITDKWVGVGYSAGGLAARGIVISQGVVSKPPPYNIDFEGFVTIASPNLGTNIARRFLWDEFSRKLGKHFADIAQGHGTFLASWLVKGLWFLVDFAVKQVSYFQAPISAVSMDLAPESSYLNKNPAINTSGYRAEASLPRGRGFIWGESDFYWRIGGLLGGRQGSNDYQSNIDKARGWNRYHNRENNRLKKKWCRPCTWPRRVWHRMRAGDWNEAIRGFRGLSESYDKLHDPWNAGSDSFIDVSSQKGWSSPNDNTVRAQVFDYNGNGVYHADMIDKNGYDSGPALERILMSMGY